MSSVISKSVSEDCKAFIKWLQDDNGSYLNELSITTKTTVALRNVRALADRIVVKSVDMLNSGGDFLISSWGSIEAAVKKQFNLQALVAELNQTNAEVLIYHFPNTPHLDKADKWEKFLIGSLEKALKAADTNQKKKVCIPPVGSKGLGYPLNRLGYILMDTCLKYLIANPSTAISEICFTCLPSDGTINEVFTEECNKMKTTWVSSMVNRFKLKRMALEDSEANVVVVSDGVYEKALSDKWSTRLKTGMNTLECGIIIYHLGSLPTYDADGKWRPAVQALINKMLSEAQDQNKKSIALPSLGINDAKYPPSDIYSLLLETIAEFLRKNFGSTIHEIEFIIPYEDEAQAEAFMNELLSRIAFAEATSKTLADIRIEGTDDNTVQQASDAYKSFRNEMVTTANRNSNPQVSGMPIHHVYDIKRVALEKNVNIQLDKAKGQLELLGRRQDVDYVLRNVDVKLTVNS